MSPPAQLAAANLHLVRIALTKFRVSGHDREDLVSAGHVGLMQAAIAFDPGRGFKFSTFALCRIRGAMLDHLRASDRLSRAYRQRVAELYEFEDAHAKAHERQPSDQDAAEGMGTTIEKVRELRKLRMPTLRLEFNDEDQEHPFVLAAAPQRHEILIEPLLDLLPPRERMVVRRNMLQGETLASLAAEMGISESRACQLKHSGLARIRRRSAFRNPRIAHA